MNNPLHWSIAIFCIVFLLLRCDETKVSEREPDTTINFDKPNLASISSDQQFAIDSFAQVISRLPDDSSKVNAIYAFANILRDKDTSACRTYANYMLWLSDEIGFDEGTAKGFYALGRLDEHANNIDAAIIHFKLGAKFSRFAGYDEGLLNCYYWTSRCYRRTAQYSGYNEYLTLLEKEAVRTRNKKYLSYAYEGFGNLYRYLGDYTRSIQNYQKAISIADSIGDLSEKSTALNNLSLVYEYENNLEEALRLQQENYEVIMKMDRPDLLVLCLSNQSASYNILDETDKAREKMMESIRILNSIPERNIDPKDRASAYGQFASLSYQDEQYDTALAYYTRAIAISETIKDRKSVSDLMGNMAFVFESMGNSDSAEYYMRQKLSIADAIDYKKGRIDANDALADFLFGKGSYSEAFRLQKKSNELRDSLQELINISRVTELNTWNKVKEQEQKIQMLSHDQEVQLLELQKRESVTYTLAGGFIITLLLSVLIYRSYRRNKQLNSELEQKVVDRTAALTRTNNDLKNFLYRSSHDLRSPIASIKGLVNIAQAQSNDTEIKQHLDKINTVIERQDMTLTTLLKISRLIEGRVEIEKLHVATLLNEIIQEKYIAAQDELVSLSVSARDDLFIHADRVILTSAIQNLVSNGVKYRHRRSNEPSYVRIAAERADNGVRFMVCDNGEGIPEEWKEKMFEMFSRGSTTAEGSGLGLYIVRNSINVMGGRLTVESKFGTGSTFIVWIPDALLVVAE